MKESLEWWKFCENTLEIWTTSQLLSRGVLSSWTAIWEVLKMHSRCPHIIWYQCYRAPIILLSLICMQIISSLYFVSGFCFIVILHFSVDWLDSISCQLLQKPSGANTFFSISLFLSKLHRKYWASRENNWLCKWTENKKAHRVCCKSSVSVS